MCPRSRLLAQRGSPYLTSPYRPIITTTTHKVTRTTSLKWIPLYGCSSTWRGHSQRNARFHNMRSFRQSRRSESQHRILSKNLDKTGRRRHYSNMCLMAYYGRRGNSRSTVSASRYDKVFYSKRVAFYSGVRLLSAWCMVKGLAGRVMMLVSVRPKALNAHTQCTIIAVDGQICVRRPSDNSPRSGGACR